MKVARITNTTKWFVIEVNNRRIYAAEGPFTAEQAIRLGNAMWDMVATEGCTHIQENNGSVDPIA